MEEQNNAIIKNPLIALLVSCIIFGGIMYGIFHWVDISTQKDKEQRIEEKCMRHILSALNQNGYKYTNKTTFTENDFTAEEVVKSDYKPIYKVNISNGDVLYIGFVYPTGKGNTFEVFCINANLDRVKNSINQ